MSKRELTPDEEWDEAQPFIRSAYIKFVAGLQQAAAGYGSGNHNKECAAMAVGATFDFVKAVHVGPHLLAPLGEALEIIGASLPDKPKDVITSMTTVRKILGSVAVEYQMLNNVSLDQALKNVVGGDARERKRLKDFRYNMKEKDSPKGAREEFFSMMRLLNESIEGLFAFLAPDLVKAAVEGRLPRGIGVERLRDASAEWTRQFEALGLESRIIADPAPTFASY